MRISLIINGKEIKAKTGMTVLEAARQGGIQIPTLCDHPWLTPSGSCRLCVVEIEGMRGYPTSCTMPAADGMVIRTDFAKLRSLRKNILELILSEHPYTCLVCGKRDNCDDYMGTIRKVGITTGCQYCPKNGACELQTLVVSLGLKEMHFPIDYRSIPVETEDPFFDRDYNLCVLCGRCVRVCNDVRRNGTLNFGFRGKKTVVGTAFGKSHLETGCEFCGACVDVCPTGALYEKRGKWEGCPEKSVTSVCPHCSVGCSLDFHLKADDPISTTPHINGTLNRGQVCVRGRFGVVDTVVHRDRLRQPMVKRDGRWVYTTWDEALDLVSEKFTHYNGEQFGMVLSPQMTNEDGYIMQKFAGSIMNSHRIAVSTGLTGSAVNEFFRILHESSLTLGTVDDIDRVSAIVVWNSDLSQSHPIVSLRVRQAQMKGTKLIVVDPSRTKLAEHADLFIQPKPGTDLLLLAGLMRTALNIGMDAAIQSIKWPVLDRALQHIDLKAVVDETGITITQMEAFTSITLKTGALFLTGHTMLTQETAKENLSALADLVQLIQPSKLLPVLGESNWMGMTKVVTALQRGTRTRKDILQEIDNGTIQCLYVSGELPEDICLDKCTFVVAQSVFKAPWMDKADVILPSAHINENEGTVVNFEGRMQRVKRVTKPSGQSRPDGWIVSRIAKKMNAAGFLHRNTADIFEEMTSSLPAWKGLTPGKLGKRGKHTGNPSSGKTRSDRCFFSFSIDAPKTESKKGYPYTLLVQWNLFHYRNGSLSALVPGMNEYLCENRIEVHPEDADTLGLQAGDSVRITTSEGQILHGSVLVTDRIPKKTAAMWVSGVTLASKLNNRTIHSVKIQKGDYD